MSNIHPTAIVSKDAEIAEGVEIGPFCVIKGKVKIGKGSRLDSHVVVGSEKGIVEMGENNLISSGAVVGGPPQDLKYNGEPTQLILGDNNVIREFATLNIGTPTGGGVTRVGNNVLLMAYVHVAHDCQLGDGVIVANSSNFAGHVIVEDHVRIGGVCNFSQFCRLGRFSFIAGDSTVNKDIIPFAMAEGKWAVARATNKIGLERNGFSKDQVNSIHKAIRLLTKGNRTTDEAIQAIEAECEPSEHINHLLQFIKTTERGIAK